MSGADITIVRDGDGEVTGLGPHQVFVYVTQGS